MKSFPFLSNLDTAFKRCSTEIGRLALKFHADIVSKWTGIPVQRLLEPEREKLLHLPEELHGRVVGQDEAVEAVSDAIQRWVACPDPSMPACPDVVGPEAIRRRDPEVGALF